MIKKTSAIILTLIALMFTFTSCASEEAVDFPGKSNIQTVVDNAAQYNSARYIITNLQNGRVEEVFSFYFDDTGRQIWLDETEVESGGVIKTGYRYYDGANITDETGKIEAATYTKDEPYGMSTGELLFFIPGLIEYGTENKETGMGDKTVMYEQFYDIKKLAKSSDSFENIESFKTTYLFEGSTFLAMTEHITYKGGVSFDYQIEIIDVNNIESIEKPS
jgi:hypothetical protein